jgi:hypothetical protein
MENASLPLLTVAILEANDSNNWEPALAYPLPPDPTIELIDDAIDQVLNFLSWVTSEVAQKDAPLAKREIERAAARLIELAEVKPKAFSAWLLDCERQRLLSGFHDQTQH